MSLFTRLTRDSFWLFLARIGAQASLVVITYLLARRLGPAGFGEYAFIATVLMIGNVLTTFGSDMFLIREIAAKADFSSLPSALLLQLILSGAFITSIFLIAPLLSHQTSASIQALKIYSFALIPLAFFTVFTSALRGTQKMSLYAWLNLAIPIIQVVAIFVFVQRTGGIVSLAYLLLGIQILGAVWSGIFCAPSFSFSARQFHFSLAALRSLFILCLPIALIAILGIVYQKLSLTMLSLLGTASMVGLFSAALRFVEAVRIGHVAVLTALYPAMANVRQALSSHKTFRSSWLVLLVVSVLASLLLFSLAQPMVDIFFGAEYAASISSLKVLAFTLIPYTVSSFLSLALLASKKEKTIVGVMAAALLIAFLNNIWLIPRLGTLGASWGTLVAEIVQAALFLWIWRHEILHDTSTIGVKGASYELSDLS